jgi:hypothetical protein
VTSGEVERVPHRPHDGGSGRVAVVIDGRFDLGDHPVRDVVGPPGVITPVAYELMLTDTPLTEAA